MSTWGPPLPQLRADLGMGDASIGVGLTASAAVLSRLGSRRAICAMLWLVSVGVTTIGLGTGLAHSVPASAIGFVLVGFGIDGVDVVNVEGTAVERAAGWTLMRPMHTAWSAGAIAGAGIGAGSAALGAVLDPCSRALGSGRGPSVETLMDLRSAAALTCHSATTGPVSDPFSAAGRGPTRAATWWGRWAVRPGT